MGIPQIYGARSAGLDQPRSSWERHGIVVGREGVKERAQERARERDMFREPPQKRVSAAAWVIAGTLGYNSRP
jgi:hypothetical protein